VEELSETKKIRELDRIFLRIGIPLLPSYKAGLRGLELAEEIKKANPYACVIESYPYSALRFLWHIRENPRVLNGPRKPIVDLRRWRQEFPPHYKREKDLAKRIKAMKDVLDLIFRFVRVRNGDKLKPRAEMTRLELSRLTDVYDSLLSLIVGKKILEDSPWVFYAKALRCEGMIPILLDEILESKWNCLVHRSDLQG